MTPPTTLPLGAARRRPNASSTPSGKHSAMPAAARKRLSMNPPHSSQPRDAGEHHGQRDRRGGQRQHEHRLDEPSATQASPNRSPPANRPRCPRRRRPTTVIHGPTALDNDDQCRATIVEPATAARRAERNGQSRESRHACRDRRRLRRPGRGVRWTSPATATPSRAASPRTLTDDPPQSSSGKRPTMNNCRLTRTISQRPVTNTNRREPIHDVDHDDRRHDGDDASTRPAEQVAPSPVPRSATVVGRDSVTVRRACHRGRSALSVRRSQCG